MNHHGYSNNSEDKYETNSKMFNSVELEALSVNGGNKSKTFIVILEQAEQLNQAIKGVKQALMLAKETNRTFVIPYVGSSKIRPPYYHPTRRRSMSYYFDMTKLKEVYYDDIIEYEEFLENGKGSCLQPYILDHADKESYLRMRANRTLTKSFTGKNFTILDPVYFNFPKNMYETYVNLKSMISTQANNSIVFIPFDRYLWSEASVPEFEPSRVILNEVERFKQAMGLNDCYISIQWRFERTAFEEASEILELMLSTITEYSKIYHNCKIYFGSDLSFTFGSMTLSVLEYNKYKPLSDYLFRMLQTKPIQYNPLESPLSNILDSGMVGIIEQQIHTDADLFIPAMVRSGFVKTILRKRELLGKSSTILLDRDKHVWQREKVFLHKNSL